MKPLVLVGSGDADFYLLLQHILVADGFTAVLAGNMDDVLSQAGNDQPNAVILDCQPGACNAPQVCAELKRNPATRAMPVVALISPGAGGHYVELLKSGIDEAFIRPVAPAKLLDFLHARLSVQPLQQDDIARENRLLSHAGIEMSLDTYRVHQNGDEVRLGPIEFKLLRHLMQSPGQVFSRDELISAAWPINIYVEARTVDVHIGHLRRSLKNSVGTNVIRTVRSAGYSLNDKAA